jgi:hypothetical protein
LPLLQTQALCRKMQRDLAAAGVAAAAIQAAVDSAPPLEKQQFFRADV